MAEPIEARRGYVGVYMAGRLNFQVRGLLEEDIISAIISHVQRGGASLQCVMAMVEEEQGFPAGFPRPLA